MLNMSETEAYLTMRRWHLCNSSAVLPEMLPSLEEKLAAEGFSVYDRLCSDHEHLTPEAVLDCSTLCRALVALDLRLPSAVASMVQPLTFPPLIKAQPNPVQFAKTTFRSIAINRFPSASRHVHI